MKTRVEAVESVELAEGEPAGLQLLRLAPAPRMSGSTVSRPMTKAVRVLTKFGELLPVAELGDGY